MTDPDRLARPWMGFPPSRRFCVSAIVVALLFTVPGAAQSSRRASQPLQLATRAFLEGRYEEVDQLTDKLDARDPNVVALKARAAIERGRYAQAETMLRPVVAQAPASEAALVLGLPQAIELARHALEINPSSVDAHVFLARQAVDASHHDEARKALDRALAVNPSSLEAHAVLAAIAYVEDKQPDFEAEVGKTLAIAPN